MTIKIRHVSGLAIQDGGKNRLNRNFSKKSTFTKWPIIWEKRYFSKNLKRHFVVHIPQIYHLFLFFEIFQDGGNIQDGVWVFFLLKIL